MAELVLQGTHLEIGRRHGECFAERIRQDVIGFWAKNGGRRFADAIEEAADYVERLFPEVNNEIRGIADGAGIGFDQAFLYNNRGIVAATGGNCSAFAVVRNGNMAVGFNKDSSSPDTTAFFAARVLPDVGHAWVGYKHVGRVWGYGINDCGLCAAGTSARPITERRVVSSLGLYFLGPLILHRCGSVAEALGTARALGEVSESGNVLFADGKDAAVLEFGAGMLVVRHMQDGFIATTNFYASGEIADASDESYLRETIARYHSIADLASNQQGNPVECAKHILSHHSEEGSICRHLPVGDATVLSFAAIPADRSIQIAFGSPCKAAYSKLCARRCD